MPSRHTLANAVRFLSIDAVQQAKSGHPGAPMGMADIAEVLWNDFLAHNPSNPLWPNRDRFVLSNGHASMLLYSLLHLSGYDLSLTELKNFRQLHSKTPGHPERDLTPGVETTTGPLGQGLANAVGMALAERTLAAAFNRPNYKIVDHYSYVFLGDGCLMEGISHEVASFAGTLGLGKLIAYWDDNGISIDGKVVDWFDDDTPARFAAYGWHVIADIDGHSPEAIKAATQTAQAVTDKPSLLCCRTLIGKGSPKFEGTQHCHGAPLGADEITVVRKQLDWPHAAFHIPDEIYQKWNGVEKGQKQEQKWQQLFDDYKKEYPELASEFKRRTTGDLISEWSKKADEFIAETQEQAANIATRKASQNCLNAYCKLLPELLGGSADLTGSNLTNWDGSIAITAKEANGNYLHYGVREFGMSAIMNGITLHGGFIPYGGTFLTFVDYARNAVRMAALMKIRSIFVYTHDSLGLGEDGPTHQPIEHASILRLTPNMSVWRPCDATESAVAWKAAIERKEGPTSLLFSRQNLAMQPRDTNTLAAVSRGGYVLKDCEGNAELILIATGSEVTLVMEAALALTEQGHKVRVVSMPSTDVFDRQDKTYRDAVLPPQQTTRLAVEAGAKDYWYKYVGLHGDIIGLTRFGESAPGNQVFEHLGFTVTHVINAAIALL